jgi:uncharacterized protein YndB with AHSA1/START domain
MTTTATATAATEVPCDPHTAFNVFTGEIGLWWKRGTMYWVDADRGLELRFEPCLGGRLIEVYDLATGEGHELGTITAWEPGERLGFTWRTPNWPAGEMTDVDVRFEPAGAATRVTIEHRGWERLGSKLRDGYTAGWAELLGYFATQAPGRRRLD